MNEQMNKWTNERMNEWTNERMNGWTNERTNIEWINERMSEWTNEQWIVHLYFVLYFVKPSLIAEQWILTAKYPNMDWIHQTMISLKISPLTLSLLSLSLDVKEIVINWIVIVWQGLVIINLNFITHLNLLMAEPSAHVCIKLNNYLVWANQLFGWHIKVK